MKSQLQPYAGPLAPAQIMEGIAAAQANAVRLLEDAKLLLDAKRYPSATAFAILSMEERGKVMILKRLAIVREPADVKAAWREYRSHRAKNAGWILPQLVAQGARTMRDLGAAVDPDAEHTFLLDAVKQISVYTDCLGNRHWSIPTDVVDEELARMIVASAETMWNARAVTLREIELFAQIVAPHYDQPGMIDAMVRWKHAIFAEGLSETAPEGYEAFVRGVPIEAGGQ